MSTDMEMNPQSEAPQPLEIPSLSKKELTQLLSIMKNDHSEALAAALSTLQVMKDNNEISDDSDEDDPVNESFASMSADGAGCYLHYDASSAKLKLQYSQTPVEDAIGFYSSATIPKFKYKKNFGRADLIGNCASGVAGRKNYYSGVCQFIRQARSAFQAEMQSFGEIRGELRIFPTKEDRKGLDVDIYVYDITQDIQTIVLPHISPIQDKILEVDAVACLPRHSDFFTEIKKVDFNAWLIEANNVGATIRFTHSAGMAGDSDPDAKPMIDIYKRSNQDEVATESGADANVDDEDDRPLPAHASKSTEGCYLLYVPETCKLVLQYSKTLVPHALGFYCAGPGHTIQEFKFKRNFGRADLIGNCASGIAGRKNYYSGWCQFIRAAKNVNGPLWIYQRSQKQTALDVDIYVYYKNPELQQMNLGGKQTVQLLEDVECNVSNIDAVTCLPKHTEFFTDLKQVDINRWLTDGNAVGATSRFD